MDAIAIPPSPRPNDHVMLWPMYAGCLLATFAALVLSWPMAEIAFSLLFILWGPLFALATIICVICAVWQLASSLVQRRWKRALSTLMLPMIFYASLPIISNIDRVSNLLHFELFRSFYSKSVQDNRSGPHWFDWGGGPMIGFTRFLIYDPTDQIVLSSAKQTEIWKNAMQLPNHSYRLVQELGDHFYVVDE